MVVGETVYHPQVTEKGKAVKVSVGIATFNRGEMLLETIENLLDQRAPSLLEIIVADQTPQHPQEVERQLSALHDAGAIRHFRFATPSITHAMNSVLREARGEIVLYVDDDVIPAAGLIEAHRLAYGDSAIWCVAGQVMQPWNEGTEPFHDRGGSALTRSLDFHFNSTVRQTIENVVGCNFSVLRERAISVGGFDDQFTGAAYRFETDFAKRIVGAGGKVLFEPAAAVRHLKQERGGLRSFGEHLRSASAVHGVGDYYFAMHYAERFELLRYLSRRFRSNVLNRYTLRNPWFLPAKAYGELRGFFVARKQLREGRRLPFLEQAL